MKYANLLFCSSLVLLSSAAGCKPRADGFTKIQHPAIAGNVEANEIEFNDGEPFGLSKSIYRNAASLTQMTQDLLCFDVVLSGFDDEAAADLARAGFVLYLNGERFTPKVEQLLPVHASKHMGKRTEWETVDTGLREDVCVEGLKNDRGEIVSCTKWQQNKITETRSYDVPQEYNVVQGGGQACFDTKGQVKPSDIGYVLLEITNAKSERTSAFWGSQYKASTRLRWDLLGDVPETIASTWGGFGGSELVKAASKELGEEPEAEKEAEPEPVVEAEPEVPEIGIEACDAYVKDTIACSEKMPEASGKPMREGALKNAEAFKKLADNKQTRKHAEQACKDASKALKKNKACK